MFNFRFRDKTNTWPAFVDLFSNLVIILIFLLIVFVFLWTTTSVFNKSSGVKTIAELKQTNAEQSQRIRQMESDEAEATRLLLQARARLESAETDLNDKDLSIVDLITAYEQQVTALQEKDAATNQQIEDLRVQLNQALVAKQQINELEQERRDLQAQMQAQMAEISAEHLAELRKLNAALAAAEESAHEQEVKYIEMSTRLNKALADKVAELKAMEEYQSEFYRSIKIALGDTTSVMADGDRFIVPSDILFQTGSYKLSDEGKNQVRLISNVIKGLEAKIPTDVDWIIRIDGHTDKQPVVPGNRAYADNMQLSILRARAVMNELVRDGVSPRRLVPSGFGDLHPMELGTDPASMQKNRRIELKLTNK
ncbi:MAG: OmpA family protein [Alphaproteobacteria bacterium]|nr:OmpA family protein [Alphaproteobacteria bacterium]